MSLEQHLFDEQALVQSGQQGGFPMGIPIACTTKNLPVRITVTVIVVYCHFNSWVHINMKPGGHLAPAGRFSRREACFPGNSTIHIQRNEEWLAALKPSRMYASVATSRPSGLLRGMLSKHCLTSPVIKEVVVEAESGRFRGICVQEVIENQDLSKMPCLIQTWC